MARPGITYRDVAEVATALLGKGQNPTIERVRMQLGTGSATTIANHLRQWKEAHSNNNEIIQKEHIPLELNAIVKGLWEKMLLESEEKIQTIEENYQQRLTNVQQELQKYKTNNQRWQQLYTQWLDEKKQLTTDKQRLVEKIHNNEEELTVLHGKLENYIQQIQEKKERITELNTMYQQIQKNLELYRESVTKQTAIAQTQFEQQKLDLENKLKRSIEQLTAVTEKKLSLQQTLKDVELSHAHLEKANKKQEAQLEKQQQLLSINEKQKVEHAQSSLHYQKMYQESQKNMDKANAKSIELQVEVKTLNQQIKALNQSMKEVTQENKTLEQANWKLARDLEVAKEHTGVPEISLCKVQR